MLKCPQCESFLLSGASGMVCPLCTKMIGECPTDGCTNPAPNSDPFCDACMLVLLFPNMTNDTFYWKQVDVTWSEKSNKQKQRLVQLLSRHVLHVCRPTADYVIGETMKKMVCRLPMKMGYDEKV